MNPNAKPGPDDFAAMVAAAHETLPEPFKSLADVVIRTPDLADDDVLVDLGMADPMDLLGLYQGVDLTTKSLFDASGEPDTVFLYRLPIIRFWMTGPDSLEEVIEHVLIHEIGHHFGLSDDDMEALEDEAYEQDGDDGRAPDGGPS